MKRLLSYIKPYVWVFIAAVGLLVVQANADLALPEYMSRIVNVGIQQGGFEDPVPEYLSESTMSGLLGILEESQAQLLRQAYRAVPTDVDVDHFPDSRNQEMYRLQELTAEDRTALEDILIPGIVGLAARQYPEMAAAAAGQPREMLTQAAIQVIRGDYRAMGADLEAIRTDFIVRTGGIMLAFTLISALSAVAVGFLAARGAAGYARDLRQGLFSRVEDFSLAEFDSFSPASLLTRTTNDVMQIQMVIIMMMRMVIYAPILGIGGIIRALETSTSMWWIIALGVGLLLVLVVVVYLLAMPRFTAIQNLTDKLNLVSREGLTGMMVIRAFNRQDHENRRFDEANTNLTDTMLFVNRVMVFMMPVMMLIMNGLSVLIIWVGSHEIAGAAMQVGDMMAFLQYSMQIVMSFLMISMMFVMIPRAAVSARRVAEVLNTPPGIVDPPENEQQGLPAGAPPGIEFQGVCFRYGHAPEDVLHDISFRIEPGQTVGIIGATGSGKSTLVNLIPRFYDVTQGSIFVAGKDVRRVSQADLRRMIGYVPQRAHLFSGSIEENLRYGTDSPSEAHHREPASPDSGMQAEAESSWESGGSGKSGSTGKSGGSRKSGSTGKSGGSRKSGSTGEGRGLRHDTRDLDRAVEIAQAREIIDERSEGYGSVLSQGGINLSGGQKQRLSIARALVKNPGIYIFDDSFSALDYRTDLRLRQALVRETAGATVVLVSQRVSTIQQADQIIVLDEGRIMGTGSHQDLMEGCPTYREIAESQSTSNQSESRNQEGIE